MNNVVPLKVTDLQKSYGKKVVLSGLSLSAGPGTVTAILGSNGSGKSTFMRCLLGLHVFSQGRIEVMGEDVRKGPGYRRFLGYMPQLPSFPENLTVREIATLVERVRGVEPDFSRGRELGVGEFLDQKWKTLSGGMKQKVNALLAVSFNPPMLVLDGPTASLDPASRIRLMDILKREKAAGKTILMTTHLLGDLWELADRLAFLQAGRLRVLPASEIPGKEGDFDRFERCVAELLEGSAA